ncbi:MAG: hypothetical protein GY768_24915 [Planctomycetaceae bacterium]|nr:hypothetical protein [Planctomycetaceae bacterium]
MLAVTVANLPAADITFDSATIGVDLIEAGGTEPTITIFWGDEAGGNQLRDWDHSLDLGPRSAGQHSVAISGLTAGTDYYYRAFAFSLSAGAQVWADSIASFTTNALPQADLSLDESPLVSDAAALIQGTIDGRSTLISATLYYGSVDGGEDAGAWEQSLELEATDGPFNALIGDLSSNSQYYLRLAAVNGGGTVWSDALSVMTVATAPLRISEVMAANASTLPTRLRLSADDSFTGPTNAHDWIEIQNTTLQPIDLSGYFLSDDVDTTQKWKIPAGTLLPASSAMVIFASGLDVSNPSLDAQGNLHANFSLDRDGEFVSLADPSGQLVDQIEATALSSVSDVSLGFFGETFGSLQIPTPASGNALVVPSLLPPTHAFQDPTDESTALVVTAQLSSPTVSVTEARLNYRRMFDDEQTVRMVDDGTGADLLANDGLLTGVIPAGTAQPGEMLRYSISITDEHGVESRMPRFLTADNSPEYYGTMIRDTAIESAVPVLHRFVQRESRAETGGGTRASVFYQGEFYDNVFIRIRGGTARSWPKKAYKIEFNDDYHFRFQEDVPRVDELNLNTTYTDKSYVRAILSYELTRDSGGVAPITFPIRVEQNGQFWNLAHFVEQPDRDYLRRNGLDPDGALYKARADRLNGLTGRAEGYFRKKTRHAEDASDLQALIDGLKLTGEELERFLFDHVDLASQINLMAVNVILQNLDATDKNYYIYRDTEGNQEWKMLPWDLDLVLGPNALNTDVFSTSDDDRPAHTSHPYMGTLDYPFHGRKNHLFHAVVNSPRTNAMFLRRVRSLMDQFMAAAETPVEQRYFENRIDELVDLLGPDVLLDKETWGNRTHFGGRRYTLEEAADRIKQDYLIPRRVHLFETHSIAHLQETEYQVVIPEGTDQAEYFVPTNNDLGLTWTGRELPANADQWKTGALGIGFESSPADYESLIQTRVSPAESCASCTSVLVRVPFSLEDPSAVEHLTLRMKYDDGVIAYVNGVEVMRANTRTQDNGFDSRGRSHRDSEAVEFENFNISSMVSQVDLGADNVLAVHLLNSSATSNDLLLSLELVEGLVPNDSAVGIPYAQSDQPSISFGGFDQNPVSGNQDEEYLELVNSSPEAFDLSGWELRGGVTYLFRGGAVIPAGESLFVSPNALAFRNRQVGPTGGQGLFVMDGYQGHLSSRSETVELVSPQGVVMATLETPTVTSDVQNHLRVTEIHYNPAGAGDATEFIELQNTSEGTTLDLTGVRITDGPSDPFPFSTSQMTSLEPGGFALLVRDLPAFQAAYPTVASELIAGSFEGALSNSGESIKVEDALNGTVLQFRYEDGNQPAENDWPTKSDGEGYSLVIRDPWGAPENWEVGSGWRASSQPGGSPGATDPLPWDADFDQDGSVGVNDLDLLSEGVRQGDLRFDLNQDGIVDANDRNLMIDVGLGSLYGDSNLDGTFDSADFVVVFRAGEYEDEIAINSGWADGDWNGDGDFTSRDLVLAFQAGSYTAGADATPAGDFGFIDEDRLINRRLADAVWARDDFKNFPG